MRFALSDIRWFPILACVLVAGADLWYLVSRGTNEGKYLGIGFFVVFAVGALLRWRLRGDRFHLVATAGAVAALGVMALPETNQFHPSHILPYVVFILGCLLGSTLSRPSKKEERE